MRAIVTKYLGPTNTQGGRISASVEGHGRVTISYPHELGDGEAAFRLAAEKLATKLGWSKDLCGGEVKNGYVFVQSSSCKRGR